MKVKGRYCIIRGHGSGVFAGIVEARNGQEVQLKDCRRLWYWNGAASISQIAAEGVKNPRDCKFTVTVDEIVILDAIEIIPCTEQAEASVRGVPAWKM